MNKEKFTEAVEVVMKYIAENHDPHTRVIIDSMRAELLSGEMVHNTDKFIND